MRRQLIELTTQKLIEKPDCPSICSASLNLRTTPPHFSWEIWRFTRSFIAKTIFLTSLPHILPTKSNKKKNCLNVGRENENFLIRSSLISSIAPLRKVARERKNFSVEYHCELFWRSTRKWFNLSFLLLSTGHQGILNFQHHAEELLRASIPMIFSVHHDLNYKLD